VDGREYPWGDTKNPTLCNCGQASNTLKLAVILQIPKTDNSPYEVMGMSGGVCEWTDTTKEKGGELFAVTRGGSWDQNLEYAALNRRNGLNTLHTLEHTGFRLCICVNP
jgi:formylglycine-generating enzyme required for sulfatase activity